MIAILDYGAGNVQSVANALHSIGVSSCLTADKACIMAADGAILPGVGAFGDAMAQLQKSGLVQTIADYLQTGKPLLGICIGEQLLFESSAESVGVRGLSILPGTVNRIPQGAGRKIPHMGWNQLELQGQDPLFAGLGTQPWFYFVHSYFVHADAPQMVLAQVEYGARMDVAVRHNNLWAVQFHPEKSGDNGLRLLRNFVDQCNGKGESLC